MNLRCGGLYAKDCHLELSSGLYSLFIVPRGTCAVQFQLPLTEINFMLPRWVVDKTVDKR